MHVRCQDTCVPHMELQMPSVSPPRPWQPEISYNVNTICHCLNLNIFISEHQDICVYSPSFSTHDAEALLTTKKMESNWNATCPTKHSSHKKGHVSQRSFKMTITYYQKCVCARAFYNLHSLAALSQKKTSMSIEVWFSWSSVTLSLGGNIHFSQQTSQFPPSEDLCEEIGICIK